MAFGYQSHLEECQLTGRKKFIALKKNQVEKIAESESENVSFVNFFFPIFFFNFWVCTCVRGLARQKFKKIQKKLKNSTKFKKIKKYRIG